MELLQTIATSILILPLIVFAKRVAKRVSVNVKVKVDLKIKVDLKDCLKYLQANKERKRLEKIPKDISKFQTLVIYPDSDLDQCSQNRYRLCIVDQPLTRIESETGFLIILLTDKPADE